MRLVTCGIATGHSKSETSVSGACGEKSEDIWEVVASRVNTLFFPLETESDSLVLSSLELTEMHLPLPPVLGLRPSEHTRLIFPSGSLSGGIIRPSVQVKKQVMGCSDPRSSK